MMLQGADAETSAERQERLLWEAVGILTDLEGLTTVQLQRKLGLDEVRRIEEALTAIATEYRAEEAASQQGRRINDAAKDLANIENACAALAAAFDKAGQDAYNVLHGLGPGGTNFRTLAWGLPRPGSEQVEGLHHFRQLVAITNRYHLPLGPQTPSAEGLDQLLARPGHDDPVFWPEAVAAFGKMIGVIRDDYELRFRKEVRKLKDIRDHGPQGTLPTSARNLVKAKKKLAGKKPPRNEEGDEGGHQNLSNIMRGPPKWILVRECCSLLQDIGHRSPNEATGSRSGWFFRFVLKVYGIAADVDVEEGEGTAGLDKHVGLVVHVVPRLSLLVQRDLGVMSPPLSDREREELGSLRRAWMDGRDPEWRE